MGAGIDWLSPDWPAPPWVRALTTTRRGGCSAPPYDGLNLADHVGDDPRAVLANRVRLRSALALPAEPRWLRQVHGTRVVDAGEAAPDVEADGSIALRSCVVCAVLTADCLPVFLCDRDGTRVAVLHAGWRGLAAGVIEAGILRLGVDPDRLLAWLGPAIGPEAFRVGPEVRTAFIDQDPLAAAAFRASPDGGYRADLYRLACRRLAAQGVTSVYGGGACTVSDGGRFFSYRRDRECGRMASLIWMER